MTFTYIIYIFAGQNVIASNVQSIGSSKSGFIEFSASKRLEKQVLGMLHNSQQPTPGCCQVGGIFID